VRVIYSSLKHVNQIFYRHKDNEPPLLTVLLSPILDSKNSEVIIIFFSSLNTKVITSVKSVDSLALDHIQQACLEWMKQATAIVSSDGRDLLGRVGKAKDLRTIIDSVWSVIQEELYLPPPVPSKYCLATVFLLLKVIASKTFSGNISYLFEPEKEAVAVVDEELYWTEVNNKKFSLCVNFFSAFLVVVGRGSEFVASFV
jgi:hypothetical protein